MSSSGKEHIQRFLAILIIVAMMMSIGIPAPIIVFFSIVVYFVWRAVQRTDQHLTGRIFEFYLAAHEILRDEERSWYGFEIREAIRLGEDTLHELPDAPPLVYFALGWLYERAGEHDRAAVLLAHVFENEQSEERRLVTPSPELKRYVQVLRRLEREPAEAPQTMAAMRGLERARRLRGAALLAESRQHIAEQVDQSATALAAGHERINNSPAPLMPNKTINHFSQPAPGMPTSQSTPIAHVAPHHQTSEQPRRPIADVLRDVYEEEKKTA